MPTKKKLDERAAEVLALAEKKGVATDFFFQTTFKRYQVQMHILEQLEGEIDSNGPLITKEYVKGRENLCPNPAITEFNKTSTAANNTVSTLINIVRTLSAPDEGPKSKLEKLAKEFE